MQQFMKKNLTASIILSKIIEILLYLVIALLSLRMFLYQATTGSDISTHISIIDPFIKHTFYIPHPGFHILSFFISKISGLPYNISVPLIMACLVIISVIVTKKIIMWFLPEIKSNIIYVLVAIALNFMTAVFLRIFNGQVYLGQWGPTIWHSPTMFLLKPFALLSFWGTLVYIRNNEPVKNLIGILVSILLLASTFTKPSFIICFIPALVVYLLIFHPGKFKTYLNVFYILLPSILLLAFQFIETYHHQNTGSYFHDRIIFTFFGFMKLHTRSILLSTLLATAFPLSVLLVINKKIKNNHFLAAGWILTIIGFLQAGLLAEEVKFNQGAFIFGYVICLFILFVFSMIEYMSWYGKEKKYLIHPVFKIIVALIGIMHLVSGFLYFKILVTGQTWL
jgi:hypothetical protein